MKLKQYVVLWTAVALYNNRYNLLAVNNSKIIIMYYHQKTSKGENLGQTKLFISKASERIGKTKEERRKKTAETREANRARY